jgi:hypothetical protein
MPFSILALAFQLVLPYYQLCNMGSGTGCPVGECGRMERGKKGRIHLISRGQSL